VLCVCGTISTAIDYLRDPDSHKEADVMPKWRRLVLPVALLLLILVPLLLAACDAGELGEDVGRGIAQGEEEAEEFAEGVKKGYEEEKTGSCASIVAPFLLVAAALAVKQRLI
jgi:hypothetical protein